MRKTRHDITAENMTLGAVFTTLSFLCIAVMGALAKVAGQSAPTGVVVLSQNLVCLLLIAPVALRHGPASLRTERIGLHLLRAATGTAAWYCLFVAITLMPLTNAVLLTYSAPLWMPLFAWVAFRHKASRATWAGAAIGFAGIMLVLHPGQDQFNTGAVFALAGALLLAIALMSVRWLGTTEPTLRILFYYFLFSTVMVAPFAWAEWQSAIALPWLYLGGVGLALLLSQILIVAAYRFAGAVKLGPFIYTAIVFTALINWAVWDRPPTILEALGMALVIGGGLVAIRGRGEARPTAAQS